MRARNRAGARQHTVTKAVKPINWKVAEAMLGKGCSGVEIAARFGINPNTLYERCEKEHGVEFTVYSAQKKANGAALVRETQYDVAIKDRDRTMLIWVGKQLCDQREPESKTVEACRPALLEYLDRLMKP